MKFYISFLSLFGIVYSCPDVNPASNFDINTHCRGRWYEVARYRYDVEDSADCVTFNFNNDGNLCIEEIKDKKINRILGGVYPTDKNGVVLLNAMGTATPNMTSYVLATDNKNYVIFYNCFFDKISQSQTEYSWILSRAPRIDPDLEVVIHKYIDESHILDKDIFSWDHLSEQDCVTKVYQKQVNHSSQSFSPVWEHALTNFQLV